MDLPSSAFIVFPSFLTRSESLHSIKYDGSNHRVLLRRNDFLHEPDSVVISKDHVIWTDRETSSLVWVSFADYMCIYNLCLTVFRSVA